MRKTLIFFIVAYLAFFFFSFTKENPYFAISKDDVKFKNPKGFPAPVYDLKSNTPTPAGFILGRKLFYDPILSRDSSTSCASCHQRFAAFAHIDHPLSHGINGLIGIRNVPALQNLAWSSTFMWDGGVNHLDLQPIAPITNKVEMDESLEHLITKLESDPGYQSMFKKAFGGNKITSKQLLQALSQFLVLMISADSKYDKFMRGETTLADNELKGLQSFRQRCSGCHPEPLFTNYTFKNIGLKADTAIADSGRKRITGMENDYMKFKVPSLRNVEMTYPYMHDGRFRTLKDVMKHYSQGTLTAEADSLVKNNLGLSADEQENIIAFLKTLTDKTFLYDRRFSEPLQELR